MTRDHVFYIVERKKELIKCRGFQVAPAELEALLQQHAGVEEAAVIGITSEGEEYPRAYVVPKDATVTETQVKSWLNERVVKYKRLTGGLIFVNSIPKTPSGKILRRTLRERAKSENIVVEKRARL